MHDEPLNRRGTRNGRPNLKPQSGAGGVPWCDACRQQVRRFLVEPVYGRTLQECGCGVVLMRPHVEMEIEIPPDHATPRRATWGWDACAACGTRYQRSPKNTTNGCSRRCQNRLRQAQRPRRVRVRTQCRTCGVSRRREALGACGRCARCRRGERYRARRLAKIEARRLAKIEARRLAKIEARAA